MGATASTSVDDLLRLVDADPQRALDLTAARLLSEPAHLTDAAELWWVRGLAERELGHGSSARVALEEAQTRATRAEAPALAARVAISLAFEVAHGGDISAALELLAAVEGDVDEADLARLANQRGILHYRQGLLNAAVDDLESSRAVAAAIGDATTELRALINLGAIHAQRGAYGAARTALLEAVTLALERDQLASAALALANLAFVETMEGDLPAALDAFASADDGYRRSGVRADLPRLWADHALALTDANLVADAEQLIDRAVALSTESGNDVEVAELLLVSAEIDLALGKPDEAYEAAVDAAQRFTRQGRESWLHVAERLRLRAQARLAPEDAAVADGLVDIGRSLAAGGWRSEALAAGLLGALLHAKAGRHERASSLLVGLAPAAAKSRATDQILLAHVLALLAEHRGDRAAARRAVSGGLRVAATTQAALGSLETRSQAAQHGSELIELGARLAVADGRSRELLHRIEAMRTMVWHAPLVRPPDDEAMATQLTELRRLTALIGDPATDSDVRQLAEQQRLGVEQEIRGLARRARGQRGTTRKTTEQAVAEAVADLRSFGDRQALAYANLDGRLLAVGIDRGRCRLHDFGPVAELRALIETCGFVLHRLNRIQGSDASRAAAHDSLADASAALGERLIPPVIARSDRPLVIIPTGVLHGVPWTALAPLRGRPVSISPSLGGWSVAARSAVVRAGRRLESGAEPAQPAGFIAGPGLTFADEEVRQFARAYRRSTVVTGLDATAEECLRLLDASELVHLACHGSFRTDNPLFSTLSLADGPLTVYDLERVSSMPGTVVLSACSVGSSAAINGGTLLGLSSALSAFGASSVVAPLTPVNDEHVVGAMQRLHTGLSAGLDPPVALAAAAADDGILDPTAAAFISIGA